MSLVRTYQRNIARNYMAEMGIGNINKKLGSCADPISRRVEHKLEKTAQGREKLMILRKESKHTPYWKRVLFGDLRGDALKAHQRVCFAREKISERRKEEKKGRWHRG